MRITAARRYAQLAVTSAALCLFAASASVAASLTAPPSPARVVPRPHDDYRPLVRYVESLSEQVVDRAKVTGVAVSIVDGDQVLLERGFGVTTAGTRETIDADTVFRLASLSKAFAGTLAALLVRDGALRWDSRVVDPVPSFQLKRSGAAQLVTLQDVLSHRIGLPFHTFDRDLEADQPYPLLAAKLAEAPIACNPGDCYAYQNIAFSLVGDLVFAATGDFYTHQVERRIFHPLGMYSATYGRDSLEASPRWARPHVRGRGGWVALRPKENYYRVPPAAGVNASIRDLSQWLIAQMGGREDVLPLDLLDEIHTPLVRTPGELRNVGWRGARVKDAHYAIGWRVFDYSGRTLVFHAGAVQGYRGMVAFFPDTRFGMAVLWNCESAVPSGIMPAAFDRYLGLASRDWTGLEKSSRSSRVR